MAAPDVGYTECTDEAEARLGVDVEVDTDAFMPVSVLREAVSTFFGGEGEEVQLFMRSSPRPSPRPRRDRLRLLAMLLFSASARWPFSSARATSTSVIVTARASIDKCVASSTPGVSFNRDKDGMEETSVSGGGVCIGRLEADDEALPERVRLGVGEGGSEEHVGDEISEDVWECDCELEEASEGEDVESVDFGGAAHEGARRGAASTLVCGELPLLGEPMASLLGPTRTRGGSIFGFVFPDGTETCVAEVTIRGVCPTCCWPCSAICDIALEEERLRWRPIEPENVAMNELRLLRAAETRAWGSGTSLLLVREAAAGEETAFDGLLCDFVLAETGITTPGAPSPRRVNLGVSQYVFCVSHTASPVGDVGGSDRKLLLDLGLVEEADKEVDVELGDAGRDRDEESDGDGVGEKE